MSIQKCEIWLFPQFYKLSAIFLSIYGNTSFWKSKFKKDFDEIGLFSLRDLTNLFYYKKKNSDPSHFCLVGLWIIGLSKYPISDNFLGTVKIFPQLSYFVPSSMVKSLAQVPKLFWVGKRLSKRVYPKSKIWVPIIFLVNLPMGNPAGLQYGPDFQHIYNILIFNMSHV